MGTMYGLLFGESADADTLLSHLGVTRDDVPRYRDCFIEDGKICLYTRMGGGNRGHWDFYDENEGADCPCPGCIADTLLPTLPGYLGNEDDEWDNTYASYYYAIPAAGIEARSGETGTGSTEGESPTEGAAQPTNPTPQSDERIGE